MERYINLYDHLPYSYIDLPENLRGFRVSGLNIMGMNLGEAVCIVCSV